jgi:hypothetical protein
MLALGISFAWACAPRLDEQQVRARLVEQLQLQNDQLRIVSITSDTLPVATVEYGGVGARVRFRHQNRVWVIDAVGQDGGWQPADRALPVFARQLTEKAHAKWIGDVMPRYARTLKLLVGWTELLSSNCWLGLPTSQTSLLNLHANWHRTLFPNRGGEFHNADLFLRDAWWKPFRLTLTVARVEVQSSGADGRMDTPDDVRLVYTRAHVRRDVEVCLPHYTMPTFVVDALGRADAPAQWNCADLLSALKKGELLDLVQAQR